MDKNSELEFTSTNEGFIYTVTIDATLELLQTAWADKLPHAGEITIESEFFLDHVECQDDVQKLMVSLAASLRKVTGKRYVIATKYNPMHDEEANEDEVNDPGFGPWEETMVLKMYLADAMRLKHENAIDSSVTVLIKATQKVSLASVSTQISQ